MKLIRRGKAVPHGHLRVLFCDDKTPAASFFSWVFLSRGNLNEDETEQVLAHESYHAMRLHSLDILLMEIITVIWWFNPVLYLYRNSLREAHEYEVDDAVCRRYDRRAYAALLLKLGVAFSLTAANMFSLHPLKDRVRMLFNDPSRGNRKWMYLLMLPLILIACVQLGIHKHAYEHETKSKNLLSIGTDTTTFIIDSTTSLQDIRQAALELKARKSIELDVLQYRTNSAGKIVLIQLKAKNKKMAGSATWDLRAGHTDFWRNYRIAVAQINSPSGTPLIYVHTVLRTTNNSNTSSVAAGSIPQG